MFGRPKEPAKPVRHPKQVQPLPQHEQPHPVHGHVKPKEPEWPSRR